MTKRSYNLPYGYTVTLSWEDPGRGLVSEWSPCEPRFSDQQLSAADKVGGAYGAAVRSFMIERDVLLIRCPDITSPATPTRH
jgi:hypothetical protein